MKLVFAFIFVLGSTAASSAAGASMSFPLATPPAAAPMSVAQSWSCSPRKTCGRINSCEEAVWYHRNCSWGGRLDGDNDGVPCESLCR